MRTAIKDKIEAISPDDQATHRDVFTLVDLRRRDGASMRIADRHFALDLMEVDSTRLITPNSQTITYALRVFYSAETGVDDRIAKDAERVLDALYSLHTEDADIARADAGPVQISETVVEGLLEATTAVAVTYLVTGV